MIIYLFRHAKKSVDLSGDPGLTVSGSSQAKNLANLVFKKELHTPNFLFSSPKLRAQQTFAPLSENTKVTLSLRDELDERKGFETSQDFRRRVQFFLRSCEEQSGVIFLCTHHDWIEEAMTLIYSDQDLLQRQYSFWQPCQFMSFEIRNSSWNLIQFSIVSIVGEV